jgi:hypothetical protein
MAAQRVQAYLDKHKIGPLFEDLMAKVIQDMPGNPINYLIRVLQKKEAKLTGKPLVNQTPTSRPSVAKWAQNAGVVGKQIGSPSHRSSTKPLSNTDTSLRKSAGNIRPTSSTTQKPGTAKRTASLSKPPRQTHLIPSSDIQNGNEIDDEELSVVLTSSKKPPSSDHEVVPSESSHRRSKLNKKAKMNERKKQLASLLSTSSPSTERSKTSTLPDSDSVEDEGVDLLEDVDDLIAEGVSSVSSGNGSRKRHMTSNMRDQDQQNVKIHICARCAQLMDSGEQGQFEASSVVSITSGRSGYASSAVTLADNERDDFFFTHRTIDDSDDDFESASQISQRTPRMPSWPTSTKGNRNKSTPSKNGNQLQGRHMYRRGDSVVDAMLSQSGRPRVVSSQSRDIRSIHSSDEWQVFDNSHIRHPDTLPASMSTQAVDRRNEEEEEGSESEETPRLLDQWQARDDGSDSSALWLSSGGSIQKRFRTRAQLNEMLKSDQSDSEPQMRPLHSRNDRRLSDDEIALKDPGLRGHQFESNDFSRTGDESDDDLTQTHQTHTRSPFGSEF